MFANCDNLLWWGKTMRLWQHKWWTDIFEADSPAETRTDDLIILLVKVMMRNVSQNAKRKMVSLTHTRLAVSLQSCSVQWSWLKRKKLKKWKRWRKQSQPEEVKRQTWRAEAGVEGLRGWEVTLTPVSAAGLQTSTAASKITEITWKQAWGRADYTNNPPQHLFQPRLSQCDNSTMGKFWDWTFKAEWDVAVMLSHSVTSLVNICAKISSHFEVCYKL